MKIFYRYLCRNVQLSKFLNLLCIDGIKEISGIGLKILLNKAFA